ncbi:MAG: O-antigen polymerase family protein [Fibrobacteres bacterium]|nr:O-antigen polymerase family protein [Fibrobacterota bacterium]
MDAPVEIPNPIDRFFLQAVLIVLWGTLSFTRMEILLYAQGIPPTTYQVLLRRDVPMVIIIAFIFLIAMMKLGRQVRIRNFWVFISLPLFIFWIIMAGAAKAEAPLFFAFACLHWVLAYLAFLIIPPLIKPFDLIDFALDAFLGCAIVVGVIHMLDMAMNPDQLLAGVPGMFGGNRAHVGLYFLISMATAFYAWSERPRRLHVAAIVVSLICLLISGSRAAQIAAAIFMCLLILARGTFKTYLLGVPTIAGFVAFFKLILADRASNAFSVGNGVTIDASAGNRLIIWLKSWEIITQSKEHFFIGIGFCNFRFLYNKLVTTPFYANAAHNLYLHYWVETGLIGLILLLAICATLFFYCWSVGKRHRNLRYMAFLTLGIIFTGFTQETLVPDASFGNVLTLYFLIMGLTIYKAAAADGAIRAQA